MYVINTHAPSSLSCEMHFSYYFCMSSFHALTVQKAVVVVPPPIYFHFVHNHFKVFVSLKITLPVTHFSATPPRVTYRCNVQHSCRLARLKVADSSLIFRNKLTVFINRSFSFPLIYMYRVQHSHTGPTALITHCIRTQSSILFCQLRWDSENFRF